MVSRSCVDCSILVFVLCIAKERSQQVFDIFTTRCISVPCCTNKSQFRLKSGGNVVLDLDFGFLAKEVVDWLKF